MNKKLYRIYDSKTGTFDRVWAAVNHADAMRALSGVVRDPSSQSPFRLHAEDYTLFCVGEISDDLPCPKAEIAEEVCGLYTLRDNSRPQAFADAFEAGHEPIKTTVPAAVSKEG